MCSYLHRAAHGVYYFRMGVPVELRPYMDRKRELKVSLGTKDRDTAKGMIPDHTKAALSMLSKARASLNAANSPAPKPTPPKSQAQTDREREEWEYEQGQDALRSAEFDRLDGEADELTEYEKRLALEPMGARLLAEMQEQVALARLDGAAELRLKLQNRHASENQNQAVEKGPVTNGKGLFLDGDILDRWAAERGVVAKGKDTHKSVAEWFYARTERKSVELITRQDVLGFKDKLLSEGQSVSNTNMKLSRLRTLLGWAYQNDLTPANVADGISVKVADAGKNKRLPFSLAELQAIFASPVYAQGLRPKRGKGEAAYWLPLLALFTGARLEEIGQLRVPDVQKHDYPDQDGNMLAGWFLHITQSTDERGQANRIKNAASERLVPVHPELERLGFIDYVTGLSDQGGRVFPDLVANIYGRLTAKWGEWFGPYLRKVCGVTDSRKVFHSYRHTFKDYMRRAGIAEGIQRQLMGHSGKDVADGYGSGYDLHALTAALMTYKVPGLKLPEPVGSSTL